MKPKGAPIAAIVTSNFWPEQSGIGQVTTEFAQYLSSRGIEVRVATAMPYYPEWKIHPGYRGRMAVTEKLGDITIHRAWHHTRPRPGSAGRLAHEGTLCLFAAPQIVRALRGAAVAYIVSPDLSLAFTASLIARAMGVHRALVVQDVQPDAAVELGMLRNPRMIKAAQRMARTIYGIADEIFTLSDGMRRRIAQSTNGSKRISLLPNTIDAVELAPSGEVNTFREKFVPEGTFAVVHAGNMGQKQDLDLILRTADRLRSNPRIHFYVFGDGAVKEQFLARRNQLELANVSHYPFQERSMLPHILAGADAVLVTQLPEVVDIVVPLKLITAMGAGAMIVAACSPESETGRIVRESGGGIAIPAGDEARLAAVIESLADGQVDTDALRVSARAYALKNFERNAIYGPQAESIHQRWSSSGN